VREREGRREKWREEREGEKMYMIKCKLKKHVQV
jgi:hypothetical protein